MMRLTALASSISGAAAWWCDGHMLVANAALKSDIMSSSTVEKATAVIEEINNYYPTSPDFVTAACWADDLKSDGAAQEANWHFIDLPVIGTPWSGTLPPLPAEDNNPWAIGQAHSTVYSKYATALDKSRQLRFLIHLVGDLHQPLHAASYYSDEFPTGDAGGNLWLVAGVNYTTELHAVWDSGAGQWVDDMVRPLNSTGQQWIDDFTTNIITAYPPTDPTIAPLIKQYNQSQWANESNQIANDFVYTAPQAPTVLPQAYIDQAQQICLRQVAIGGYRLADLIEYIFTSTTWGEEAYAAVMEARALRAAEGKGSSTAASKAQRASSGQAGATDEERIAFERPHLRAAAAGASGSRKA